MVVKKECGLFLAAALLVAGTAMAGEAPNREADSLTPAEVGMAVEAPPADRGGISEQGTAAAPSGESVEGTKETAGREAPSAMATAEEEEEPANGVEEVVIADPIEPWNRAMFTFNDKLYFWVLKPVARGYKFVVPEPARISVRNFFANVKAPVRFANTILQGKFRGASTEFARFVLNSTVGLAGLFDVAKSHFELDAYDEDFGQTLGFYGVGGMMYIVWPILGPSTVRDTVGMAGDSFLNPVSYITPYSAPLGVKAYEQVNKTSLELGTYEDIIAASVEPYVGVRDGFIQHRKKQINK